MSIAVVAYGVAAILDWYTRRVPDGLWIFLGLVALWQGVSLAAVSASLFVFIGGLYAWHRGELGGADVKGIAICPLVLPTNWPIAIGCGLLCTAGWMAWQERNEVPLFVGLFPGIGIAAFLSL